MTEEQKELDKDINLTYMFKGRLRVQRVFDKLKIKTYRDLVQISKRDILNIWNVGEKTYWDIVGILAKEGLSLGVDVSRLTNTPAAPEERDVKIVDSYVKLTSGRYVYCHTRVAVEILECCTDCAAYYEKDGRACCKLMQGDKIIGRIIEPTEKDTAK